MNTVPNKQNPKSREKKLFRLTLIVYAALFVGAFIPLLGLIVYIPFFCTGLLWCYAGLVAVCASFPVSFVLAKRKGSKAMASTSSAIRWSVIVFGALGLALWPTFLIVPGYKPFTLGYWIHAKIWLNVAQIREWATHQDATTGPSQTVPYTRWPSTLKRASLGSGRVRVDPETRSVMLVDGGGFGHWGIRVAGTAAAENRSGNYSIKLEDGAWVWHEIQ